MSRGTCALKPLATDGALGVGSCGRPLVVRWSPFVKRDSGFPKGGMYVEIRGPELRRRTADSGGNQNRTAPVVVGVLPRPDEEPHGRDEGPIHGDRSCRFHGLGQNRGEILQSLEPRESPSHAT